MLIIEVGGFDLKNKEAFKLIKGRAEKIFLDPADFSRLPGGEWRMKRDAVKKVFKGYLSYPFPKEEPEVFCPRQHCDKRMNGGIDREKREIR